MLQIGLLFLAAHCLFNPPKDWDIADPKMPSQRSIIGFLEKKTSGFCPSMHLTHEQVSIPLEDYLEIVQKNCKSKHQQWHYIGKIQTRSGEAALTQIETKTKFGPVRLFQAILLKNQEAYILTTAALRKDFATYASLMEEAIRSMFICEDLFSMIHEEALRSSLLEAWQKRKNGIKSNSFEKLVLQKCSDLGVVWQISALKQ